MEWNDMFMELFTDAVVRYHSNHTSSPERFFSPGERDFLSSIGYQPREMYNYIVEYARCGEPTASTALLIASRRRTYFHTTQRGILSNAMPVTQAELYSPDADYQGYVYMPLIIGKAEAKLRGTLDARIMYGDAADREFLRKHGNIHLSDFLGLVNAARGDKQKLITSIIHIIHLKEIEDREAKQRQQAAAPPSQS